MNSSNVAQGVTVVRPSTAVGLDTHNPTVVRDMMFAARLLVGPPPAQGAEPVEQQYDRAMTPAGAMPINAGPIDQSRNTGTTSLPIYGGEMEISLHGGNPQTPSQRRF